MDTLFDTFANKYRRIKTDFVRSIDQEIAWDAPLIGIRGARGVGKTTLLLQHIKQNFALGNEVLYASVDNIWFNGNSIYALARTFSQHGGKYLFLDEVHKYPNWSQELKNIYDDMPDLHVVFTGSSLLEILNSRADLSRRSVFYEMQGFSYREYLNWTQHTDIAPMALNDVAEHHTELAAEVTQQIKVLQHFDDYLHHGYYPFYHEMPAFFYSRLAEVVNMVLEVELPQLRDVDIAYVHKIKQLLYIISESAPFTPNITKIGERIGLSRVAILGYLAALNDSRITFSLNKESKGLARLQKPEKIYLDNTNLIYALGHNQVNRGTLRETFVANQLRYKHQIESALQGDFFVDNQFTFEVGGAGKGQKQINQIDNAYIVADDIEVGRGNKIPLWMFGLLY